MAVQAVAVTRHQNPYIQKKVKSIVTARKDAIKAKMEEGKTLTISTSKPKI